MTLSANRSARKTPLTTASQRIRAAPVVALTKTMWRVSPALAAAQGGVIAAAAALPTGLALSSGALVGALASTVRPREFQWGSYAGPVLALGVLFLLFQLLPPLGQAISETLGRRVDRAVRLRVLAALDEPPDVAHLEDPAVADLVGAVNGGLIGTAAKDAVVGMANMGIARGGPLLGTAVLIAYHWWLGLVLLAVYSYTMLLVSTAYQQALESAEGSPALMRRAMYLKDLACTTPGAKEIRTFGLTPWLLGRYGSEFLSAITRARRERTAPGLVSLVSGAIVLAGQGVTFMMLAFSVMNHALSLEAFTVFAVSSIGLVGVVAVIPDLLNIAVGGTILKNVSELERRMGNRRPPAPALASPTPALRQAIVFEGVGFRYPGSDFWVLRHLDLTIPVGASLSIVGDNGAGKTTLVKLLCGLYRPTEGRILADGVDVRDLDERAWQRKFAALFQDWVRWGLPLRDNILLGAPDLDPDSEMLDAVARGADLTEVIGELSAGWDTVLSREFGGMDLSGGQWQRVGLARALWALNGDAEVLILDEPTSSLDVRGELELFDRLLVTASGKTLVLISHRFSTVRHTDHIVVLADGKVCEQGSHAELMVAGGRYAAMFSVQADRFVANGRKP